MSFVQTLSNYPKFKNICVNGRTKNWDQLGLISKQSIWNGSNMGTRLGWQFTHTRAFPIVSNGTYQDKHKISALLEWLPIEGGSYSRMAFMRPMSNDAIHKYSNTKNWFMKAALHQPRPQAPPYAGERAWCTPTAHALICTQNLGTSYISVKFSVNYQFTITSPFQIILAFGQQKHEENTKSSFKRLTGKWHRICLPRSLFELEVKRSCSKL